MAPWRQGVASCPAAPAAPCAREVRAVERAVQEAVVAQRRRSRPTSPSRPPSAGGRLRRRLHRGSTRQSTELKQRRRSSGKSPSRVSLSFSPSAGILWQSRRACLHPYAAVAFVIAQVADIAFPALHLPGWTLTLMIVLLLLEFPVALLLAWAYDVTPEGLVRAGPAVDRAAAERPRHRDSRGPLCACDRPPDSPLPGSSAASSSYRSTFARERGRVAALLGDTAVATHSWSLFLAMRRNAEPDRRADVERVGRELARLRDGR
jgi:hypothetical protein